MLQAPPNSKEGGGAAWPRGVAEDGSGGKEASEQLGLCGRRWPGALDTVRGPSACLQLSVL